MLEYWAGCSTLLCRRTCSLVLPVPRSSSVLLSQTVFSPRHRHLQSGFPLRICLQSLQSLVISCTMFAVSGHLLYCVCSLWSSPVLCLQSLVIPCAIFAVSGHLLYYICSLWSSPVLCLQSLVISCTMSAVSGHFLYYVCS
ncbi:unnamed protein product, partial [Staurois parvus]